MEQLIIENRRDEAKNLLIKSKDLLELCDYTLYEKILDEEYHACIEMIDGLHENDKNASKRYDYWRCYCNKIINVGNKDELDGIINEYHNNSDYVQNMKAYIEKKNYRDRVIMILLGIISFIILAIMIKVAFVCPRDMDKDVVFTKAFGIKSSDVVKLYDEENNNKMLSIYGVNGEIYYCFFENNQKGYRISHFIKRQIVLLDSEHFLELEKNKMEKYKQKWQYNSDKTICVIACKANIDVTEDNKQVTLENKAVVNNKDIYVYSLHD